MKQLRHFDRYLASRKNEREEDPFRTIAQNQISTLSKQYKQGSDQLTADLSRRGFGANTIAEGRRSQSTAFQETAGNIYNKAASEDQFRRDEITADIDKVQLQRDEGKQQIKDQQKQEKKAWWEVGGSIFGAAVGTLIAPGVGTLLGAEIGGGVGQVGGELAAGDDMSSASLIQGLGDTISAVSDGFTLKREKAFGESLKNNFGTIANMDQNQLSALSMFLDSGNITDIEEFINSMNTADTSI